MSERVPTYAEQRAWEEQEQRFFLGIGEELREIFPRERWHDLDEAERERVGPRNSRAASGGSPRLMETEERVAVC